MKFDTKKCSPVKFDTKTMGSPISLARSSMASLSVVLDDCDLAYRNPNVYLSESEDEENRDENNETKYGRRIEHLPRVVYTPVKVSTRNKRRTSNCNGVPKVSTRTVTLKEMKQLNTSLANLRFDDENHEATGRVGADDHAVSEGSENDGGAARLGRVPQEHVDPKTGKTITVLRSSRVRKKPNRL